MRREWRGFCHRCGKASQVHSMSRFNTDLLCPDCLDREQEHPDYEKAAKAEREAVQQGNYNFPGIGWTGMPGD